MAQKMTLSAYLAQRGKKAKALTKGEAGLLGIPYPLQAGWPRKYGATEIDEGMIEQLAACVEAARLVAEERERRKEKRLRAAVQVGFQVRLAVPLLEKPSPVPGFALRRARRFRKSAPWAE